MKIWAGRILSGIAVALLLLSAGLKLTQSPQAVEGFTHRFGFSAGMLVPIGILELACTVLYVIPQTAVLGAILVGCYLGGAVATEVRVGGANFVLPLLIGVFAWLGLWLREERLKPLVPLRTTGSPSAAPPRAS